MTFVNWFQTDKVEDGALSLVPKKQSNCMSGSFHFSLFGQSDQRKNNHLSIFCRKICILPENDSWFFVFGHFDPKTKNGMNQTLESKTPTKNFTGFENDL